MWNRIFLAAWEVGFKQNAARLIGILFHPLLVPSACYFLIAFLFEEVFYPMGPGGAKQLVVFIFITTYAFPVIILLILYLLGKLANPFVQHSASRARAMLVTLLMYSGTTGLIFYRIGGYHPILLPLCLSAVLLFFLLVTDRLWMISAHVSGVASVLGFLNALLWRYPHPECLYIYMLLILFTGVVAWSRLYLGAHGIRQVGIGLLVGLSVGVAGGNFI